MTLMQISIAGGLATAAVAMAAGGPNGSFLQEWKAWHAQRLAQLQKPVGWLSLVGLHWLEPGENRIEGLPGVFTLEGGAVKFTAPGAEGWTFADSPLTSRVLTSDRDGRADRIARGTITAQVIDRGGKLALRVWDSDSPIRKAFTDIDSFPPDPRWRVIARWDAYDTPHEVEVPNAAGMSSREKAPGRAWFTIEGKEYSLEPTIEGDALSFVFKDRTAPKETYGGGRFLMAAPAQNGQVVLDFNRAYNPPCVFTAYATCPLPLPYNVLPFRVDAGEKNWGHATH